MIVVLFKIIYVNHDQRQRFASGARLGPFDRVQRVEHAAVCNACQAVAVGEHFQLALQLEDLVLGLLTLGNVKHEANQRFDAAVLATHHVHYVSDPNLFSVGR